MKNGNRRAKIRINSAVLIGVFFILAAVVAVPVYTTRSAAQSLKAPAGPPSVRFFTGFSNIAISPLSSLLLLANPQSPAEMIETFASDCITPKTDFDLGETVCAKITGAPLPVDGRAARRIGWVSPYGSLAQGAEITTDPQTGTYLIPTTQTQTFTDSGGGTIVADNRGTWTVNTFSAADGSLKTSANFTVHDPDTPYVDLSVGQSVSETNSTVPAGSSSVFNIIVSNRGPDAGANVVLTGAVPNDSTFVAMTQTSGPTFSCTTPLLGGTGAITCSIASLAKDATATFDLAYNVNAGTSNGTLITSNATISSATAELVADDNASTRSATVGGVGGGGGGETCTVACPDDIQTPANTVDVNNDPGAVVHFSPPSGNTACGTVVADHCNDCFFPVGTTVVTGTGVGSSCSFTVTVTPAGGDAPTISCPSNQTANADSNCAASLTVGTATATGTNVSVIGFRSDGKPMYTCDVNDTNCTRNGSDAPFGAGITTITWIAYSHDAAGPYTSEADEESHRIGSASCTQIITVNDVTPPNIVAPANRDESADATCQFTVPDYTTEATVSDNCACSSSDESEDCQGRETLIITQSPAPGTVIGLGPQTITLTANDGSSNNGGAGNTATTQFTITVKDTTAPSISCPSNIEVSNDPGLCSAVVDPGTATATDNCDGTPTIAGTRSDNQPLNAPYPVGVTIITWSATDDAGNTSSCNQSVTVNDTTAPTVTAPPDSSASADANCQAPVPNYAAGSTAADNCDSSVTVTQTPAAGTMVGKGSHTVTVTATDDAGNQSSDTVVFTVNDNTAPTITCPANITTGTDPNTCSANVNPGTATATDNCDGSPTVTSTRSDGQAMNAPYPKGTTTITWRATDDAGNYSECPQTVTVVDDDAPTFTFTGTQTMWPPNHKYKTFTVANLVASVSDNCDVPLALSKVIITKVTSDEIENGNGDGNTSNDIIIGANCRSVQLRSERDGGGNGRVYTIFFSVTDNAGNVGTGTTTVVVPHNNGGTAVDSGPHYTVMSSNCPP
ncbi:MAG: HYR domain-containing protein [Pyrinomonadaceae bacterium]